MISDRERLCWLYQTALWHQSRVVRGKKLRVLKQIIFDCDVSWRDDDSSYDTHAVVVISHAKFDAPTFSSFGGIKTHRTALYAFIVLILDHHTYKCMKRI